MAVTEPEARRESPLDSVLNADTETFAIGPYERAVRLRRWIYIFCFLCLVMHFQWIDAARLFELVAMPALRPEIVRRIFGAALLYFFVQFSIVLIQVIFSYGNILKKRFQSRSDEQLRELRREMDRLEREQKSVYDMDERISARQEPTVRGGDDLEQAQLLRRRRLRDAEEEMIRLRERGRDIEQNDDMRNPFVRIGEVLLDVLRLAPPWTFAAYVLTNFVNVNLVEQLHV
ncbi:MAG: hypothetical protein NW203_02985 [Hyphomonadaceae bacterium]|nr:hypothetical protein [Hyphomonadaceae bacterium]